MKWCVTYVGSPFLPYTGQKNTRGTSSGAKVISLGFELRKVLQFHETEMPAFCIFPYIQAEQAEQAEHFALCSVRARENSE